jgi:hypothetical protein
VLVPTELRQKVAELETRRVQVQQQHAAEIRQLQSQKSLMQTRLFERRYSEAQPQLPSIVLGLQHQVFVLSAQMAANAYARSCMPNALVLDQFKHGASLRQLPLGVVKRSDSDAAIDLFELACQGKKTGTLRLGEHAATFEVGQFVFLRAHNKRLRLVQIASVSQPEAWGAICADPVRKTHLIPMEGLYFSAYHLGVDPAFSASHVDFWTSEMSTWLANFWPMQAETDKDTDRLVLKNTTQVRTITWTLV